VPNRHFWQEFDGLVLDGIRFIARGCKKGPRGAKQLAAADESPFAGSASGASSGAAASGDAGGASAAAAAAGSGGAGYQSIGAAAPREGAYNDL
jgi:hypothetical protein